MHKIWFNCSPYKPKQFYYKMNNKNLIQEFWKWTSFMHIMEKIFSVQTSKILNQTNKYLKVIFILLKQTWAQRYRTKIYFWIKIDNQNELKNKGVEKSLILRRINFSS
jgi:hypothetical protein